MLGFIKKCFFTGLAFSSTLTSRKFVEPFNEQTRTESKSTNCLF